MIVFTISMCLFFFFVIKLLFLYPQVLKYLGTPCRPLLSKQGRQPVKVQSDGKCLSCHICCLDWRPSLSHAAMTSYSCI